MRAMWGFLVPKTVMAAFAATVAMTLTLSGAVSRPASAELLHGDSSQCDPWVRIFVNLGFYGFEAKEIAEEGWIWVNGAHTTDKFRSASGVATRVKVAHNDTPSNHFSHDLDVDIRVDPGQEELVSTGNDDPDTIELEWESGVLPNEKTGDGAHPIFARWALPNLGDRVWTNGHWVFDCGHSKDIDGANHYHSEIHPPRAIASMRRQAQVIPGSGTTPVPVTATDLYIHGRGGFMVQQLECEINVILSGDGCATKTTPIDTLYTFDICLPPKPVASAVLARSIAPGPDNSGIGADPDIQVVPASDACKRPLDEFLNDFDDTTMLRAVVNLSGTGITPDKIYSRKMLAGWVYPPANPLPHLTLKLDRLDLHNDHEGFSWDGEFTFWWMSVNQALNDEWYRLVNFEIPTYEDVTVPCPNHTNRLNDMDDDGYCGNGELNFAGPTWTFYVEPARGFLISATGFEQDCYDDYFGSGYFDLLMYTYCHFGIVIEGVNDWGNNDPLPIMNAPVGGPGIDPLSLLGSGKKYGVADEFDFYFTLSQIPPADEDKADLAVAKTCSGDDEVPLAGKPFTCTIVVTNAGPGLPRNVVVTDALISSIPAADYTVGTATFRAGSDPTMYPCGASSATGFSCSIGTVPVGGSVTIQVQITPRKPAKFTNRVAVSTASTDVNAANNEKTVNVQVYLGVTVDILPGSLTNPVNVGRAGVISVAILSDAGFDASRLTVATACFGDAEDPSQRACTLVRGGPRYEDVDKDKDIDLLLQFDVLATGIDLGDTKACLRGQTTTGIGFYGCDVITTLP